MYNVLIDGFPSAYKIGEKEYRIRTSYKIGVLLSQMMADPDIDDDLRFYIAIETLYIDKPEDIIQGINGVRWFLSCGKSEIHIEGEKHNDSTDEVINFDFDQLDIWAAFTIHHITLTDDLHYWQFISLLPCLVDTPLAQKMQYRGVDLKDLKGETKKFYSEQKKKYKIKPIFTKEEYEEQMEILRQQRGDYYMKLRALNN